MAQTPVALYLCDAAQVTILRAQFCVCERLEDRIPAIPSSTYDRRVLLNRNASNQPRCSTVSMNGVWPNQGGACSPIRLDGARAVRAAGWLRRQMDRCWFSSFSGCISEPRNDSCLCRLSTIVRSHSNVVVATMSHQGGGRREDEW